MITALDPVYRRDLFRCHLSAVDTLRRAGIDPPPEWLALVGRFAAYVDSTDSAVDRLTQEVVSPSGDDVVLLRAAAITEEIATGGTDAAVTERVRAGVLRQLQALYEPVAQANYRTAAGVYNDAAERFTNSADLVDVEAGGEVLVGATQGQRDAWLSAPDAAAQLEEALRVLCSAAALAGAPGDVAFISQATDVATAEVQIAIACDPGKAHCRKVWQAWLHTGGRTGRWAGLRALGVKFRAASHPDRVTPYSKPQPFIAVVDRGNKIQKWDPHDGKPPKGWRAVLDGWADAEDEWSSSVV